MEVGNGMSENEDRAHFSIWAMMASPLIAGNDLRSMSDATRAILTNQGMLAINQDPLGVQAMKWVDDGDVEIFIKPLVKGDYAVMFLNRADQAVDYSHDWAYTYMKDDISNHEIFFDKQSFNWIDVWGGAAAGKNNGSTKDILKLKIPAHAVVVLRLTPQ
jgi:alpha-galactosidase